MIEASNRLTLRLIGTPEDNGDVRFDAFIRQLNAVRDALIETDRVISHGRSVYYRVVDLRHLSPSTVELEAVPIDGEQEDTAGMVVDTFYTAVSKIQDEGYAPPELDYEALEKFKNLTGLLGTEITKATFTHDGNTMELSESLSENVDKILGPDEYEIGSVAGMLHHLNLHSKPKVFTIYPTAGRPRLRCTFPEEKRDEVIAAVDQYVRVTGRLKSKMGTAHPNEMAVENIEVYPDESDLPKLADLEGVAPEATGDKTSDEFVRDLRSEW